MHDLHRLFVGYVAVETADGGAAQSQTGNGKTAAAEHGFFDWIHFVLLYIWR